MLLVLAVLAAAPAEVGATEYRPARADGLATPVRAEAAEDRLARSADVELRDRTDPGVASGVHRPEAPDDVATAARRFAARTGIALECAGQCPHWTADAISDFDAALAALPEKLRRPTPALTLSIHSESAAFGMGDGSSERPEWSEDRARFHVYSPAPTTERRAGWRLSNLTEAQQRSVWLRRALVHALLARADEVHGLSRTKRWRRLSGFSDHLVFGERALNVFDGAYSRLRGKASAQLDLLTFAEEHFIPAESLSPDALHVDDTVACQELSKSRVLSTLLFEAGLWPTAYTRPRCPAFEGWANLANLESIEVLLVASSGRKPESLFGHLLLRPTHRQGEWVKGPTFQSAVQIAAITDGEQKGPMYLARGIFGGYRTAIFTLSMRDLEREVLEDEQRLIRRFRLELTADENERVMERVWDLERRGYYDYKFFTDNCATTLAQLIEGGLGEETELKMPGALLAAPSSALDGLARVVRERDGVKVSLLRREGADLEPSSLVAERGLSARQDAQRRWLDHRPPFERSRLQLLFEQLADELPARRGEAYAELATFPPLSEPERAAQFDFWLGSVRVERYGVDLARKALLELSIATLNSELQPRRPEDQLSERQALFERESNLARHFSELDRAEAARERIARMPHRPLTDEERAEQRRHEATLALWKALTTLHGDVIERDHPRAQVKTALSNEEAATVAQEQAWEPTALMSSGSWRLAAGASWDNQTPGFRLHSAALSERLGDQRVRGFQPSTELHFLDADTTFTFDGDLPRVSRSDFIVFGWRSLGRTPSELRTSFREALGYGLSIATDHRDGRVLADRVRVDFEAFAVLDESKLFDRHLAVGIGPRALVAFGEQGIAGSAGPRAVLVQRVPLWGHSANALRLEAGFAPLWSVGAQKGLQYEATAALETDVRVVIAKGVLLLRPRLCFEAEGARRSATGSLLIEPVEWKL